MVRHMRDAGFGLAPFGDVDDGDQEAVAALEGDGPSEGQHLDLAAVGFEMSPVAGMIGIANLPQRLAMGQPFILRPDLVKLHAQKPVAAEAIMLYRRIVDAEETGGLASNTHIGIGLWSNSRRNKLPSSSAP